MISPAHAAYARSAVERAEQELVRTQYDEGRVERRGNWWDVEPENASRV